MCSLCSLRVSPLAYHVTCECRAACSFGDAGIQAIADAVAQPSALRVLHVAENFNVTAAGWAALSAAVYRNPCLELKYVFGVDLVDMKADKMCSNSSLLTRLRKKTHRRVRARVRGLSLLRTAWRQGAGKPARASLPAKQPVELDRRAAALAHMLQLRRLCRVRGDAEAVEPFGRAVVMYLGGHK